MNESWSYASTPDVRNGKEPLYQAFQLHAHHFYLLELCVPALRNSPISGNWQRNWSCQARAAKYVSRSTLLPERTMPILLPRGLPFSLSAAASGAAPAPSARLCVSWK